MEKFETDIDTEKHTERQASLRKERPDNKSDKRFLLSREQFSKDRIEALREEIDAMKSKYPEVLSLCLFGSMVKGTAHEESDIDGYLLLILHSQQKNNK